MKNKMTAISVINRNVIGEALTDVSSDVLAYLPKKKSLQTSLNSLVQKCKPFISSLCVRLYRNADHLPVPTSAKFDIPEVYSQFILHDSGGNYYSNRILVLGDKDVSLKLHADTLFDCGTFDKVPSMFSQLYTWHAQVGKFIHTMCVCPVTEKKSNSL